jgi:two-component sensor histidine kinase
VDTGALDLSGASDGQDLELIWTERGGPRVKPPKDEAGYGSGLIKRSVAGQLRGTINYDWAPEGVIITLRTNGGRLAT